MTERNFDDFRLPLRFSQGNTRENLNFKDLYSSFLLFLLRVKFLSQVESQEITGIKGEKLKLQLKNGICFDFFSANTLDRFFS